MHGYGYPDWIPRRRQSVFSAAYVTAPYVEQPQSIPDALPQKLPQTEQPLETDCQIIQNRLLYIFD